MTKVQPAIPDTFTKRGVGKKGARKKGKNPKGKSKKFYR